MRCKVGDVVVVKKAAWEENLGRFGTIMRSAADIGEPTSWWVKPRTTFMGHSWLRGNHENAGGTVFADDKLMPVNPGDLVEDTETAQEKETV